MQTGRVKVVKESQSVSVGRAYDAIADSYESEYRRAIDRAEDDYVTRLLREVVSPGDRVLDVGCGTGHFFTLMNEYEYFYTGVDPSEGMLRIFREHPDGRIARANSIHHGTAAHTGENPGKFDAVVSLFGSWSYEVDAIGAFHELARVLKPGGRFLIVACGHRYITRRNYIFNKTGDIHAHCYYGRRRIPLIERQVPALQFDPVRGFNAFGDGTYGRLGRFCAAIGLRVEAGTVGRYAPELCFWTVLSGVKRG